MPSEEEFQAESNVLSAFRKTSAFKKLVDEEKEVIKKRTNELNAKLNGIGRMPSAPAPI